MSIITRMQLIVCSVLLFAAAGCNERPAPFTEKDKTPKADRDAPNDPPRMYPGWAYDSERYVQPVDELKPAPRIRPGDPLHYFTNKKIVMIRQPSGYTPEEVPRVAIWWSDDNGFHWNKGGYFGRQQSYFPFEAANDGDYGIRFVGPNQPTAEQVPPTPERVYHIDTIPPEVTVRIEPEQSWYHVGDTITISWEASDNHLIEYPVHIALFSDFSADKQELIELQRDLADKGSITYKIPPEALDHELRFRVDALDRAGNLGTAVSYALQVVNEAATEKGEIEKKESGKKDESSAEGAEDKSSSAAQEMGDEEVSRDDKQAEDRTAGAPVAKPLGEGDAAGNDDLLKWKGPFFASASASDPKAAAQSGPAAAVPMSPWYKEALAKITDLPTTTDNEEETTPAATDAATPPPATDSVEADAPTDQVAKESTASAKEEPASAEAPETQVNCGSEASAATPGEPPVFDALAVEASDTAELSTLASGVVSVVDPTRGNGLFVPLPATVEPPASGMARTQYATAHPWRILGGIMDKPMQSIWELPKPRFALELYRTLEGRFLADKPILRPVAMPGETGHTFAGGSDPRESARQPDAEP